MNRAMKRLNKLIENIKNIKISLEAAQTEYDSLRAERAERPELEVRHLN